MSSWIEVSQTLHTQSALSPSAIHWTMGEILEGRASDEEITHFLIGMRDKGETSSEISAMVDMLYRYCAPITITERAVDTVGTGGDGANTINISTTAAIITTAAGARTVKHGNRAASSKSGAADLLEELGVSIDLDGEEVARCVHQIGIGFCFAPKFHSAMRFAAPARKALGTPTVFNVLGPLANPARPQAVAIGVANPRMLPLMAKVLADSGKEGFLFRGEDGLDELTLSSPSVVIQIHDGELRQTIFDPRNVGLDFINPSEIVGGDARHNARIVHEIFAGKEGPAREIVLLNAAAAIAAFKGDFHLGFDQQIANALVLARQAVDSGAAATLLKNWVAFTQAMVQQRGESQKI